jgi:hypothetical protein
VERLWRGSSPARTSDQATGKIDASGGLTRGGLGGLDSQSRRLALAGRFCASTDLRRASMILMTLFGVAFGSVDASPLPWGGGNRPGSSAILGICDIDGGGH